MYLSSNFYMPRRMIEKFERFIKAIMQNGLKKFYRSNAYHLAQFCNESNSTCSETTSHNHRIEMKDLRIIFFIYFTLNLLATLAFGLEFAWFHFEKRRQH